MAEVEVKTGRNRMRLFVGGLARRTNAEDLKDLFDINGSNHGIDVIDAVVIMDNETGISKGFGFVELEAADKVGVIVGAFDKSELHGRRLTVNVATPREERGNGGGGGSMGSRQNNKRRDPRERF